MSEQSENIYINLVKNPKWDGVESNQPIYVGPPNVEAQQKGKNWTIGAKINGVWYNQAAFPTKDKNGNKDHTDKNYYEYQDSFLHEISPFLKR